MNNKNLKGGLKMLQVGQKVPNFELEVYYPATKSFGKVLQLIFSFMLKC